MYLDHENENMLIERRLINRLNNNIIRRKYIRFPRISFLLRIVKLEETKNILDTSINFKKSSLITYKIENCPWVKPMKISENIPVDESLTQGHKDTRTHNDSLPVEIKVDIPVEIKVEQLRSRSRDEAFGLTIGSWQGRKDAWTHNHSLGAPCAVETQSASACITQARLQEIKVVVQLNIPLSDKCDNWTPVKHRNKKQKSIPNIKPIIPHIPLNNINYRYMCKFVIEKKRCPHKVCHFAHNFNQLNIDMCNYGNKCHKIHIHNNIYMNNITSHICKFIHIDETKENYYNRIYIK